MAKRKNTRMFPRDERRGDTTARRVAEASLTDEQRDVRTITATMGRPSTKSAAAMAEAWLSLADEPQREPYETDLMRALARQFKRATGRTITRDEAEVLIDPEPEYADYLDA